MKKLICFGVMVILLSVCFNAIAISEDVKALKENNFSSLDDSLLKGKVLIVTQSPRTSLDEDGDYQRQSDSLGEQFQAQFGSIQAAIDAASYGDTVIVAPGTYYEAITMKEGVDVIGSGRDQTTIDAGEEQVDQAVLGASHTQLKGFTIQHNSISTNWKEAVIYLSGIRNMKILNNRLSGKCLWHMISLESSNFNVVSNNVMGFEPDDFFYHTIMIDRSSYNYFSYNQVKSNLGNAIHLNGTSFGPADHNQFHYNFLRKKYPPAGMLQEGSVRLFRARNTLMTNNTIIETMEEGSWPYSSGAIVLKANSDATLINNIIKGHKYGVWLNNASTVRASYSDIYYFRDDGEYVHIADGSSVFEEGDGVLYEDPRVNNETGQLSPLSPCIDAGDPVSMTDPDGSVADMGAFFYRESVLIEDPLSIG